MGKFKALALSLPLAVALVLPPDAADARRRDKVAAGIGIGLIGGAIASRGDPGAMIGGAIAGGIVGKIASDRDRRHREWRRDYRNHRYHR
jgi:hypothetical protein